VKKLQVSPVNFRAGPGPVKLAVTAEVQILGLPGQSRAARMTAL